MELRESLFCCIACAQFVMFSVGCAVISATRGVQIDDAQVTLTWPGAREVKFASSLDQFQLRDGMKENGKWSWKLKKDREFTFFFIVDGEVAVPDCELTAADDFGLRNCIYVPGL